MKRVMAAALAVGLGLVVAGCAEGYGRGGYGYGDGYGYASDPYWGWYGNYYYPGTGFYVYDRYRRPIRWNEGQRRYWEGRRQAWRGHARDNWTGFAGTNGYRYDGKSGRERPSGYRDRGYRTRSTVAVPQDAQPPAYRSGAPERPAGGRGDYHRPADAPRDGHRGGGGDYHRHGRH